MSLLRSEVLVVCRCSAAAEVVGDQDDGGCQPTEDVGHGVAPSALRDQVWTAHAEHGQYFVRTASGVTVNDRPAAELPDGQ
jgi:hypothetical protein